MKRAVYPPGSWKTKSAPGRETQSLLPARKEANLPKEKPHTVTNPTVKGNRTRNNGLRHKILNTGPGQ